MASITFNTSAASWTPGASWVGGVAPTAADDALIVSTSGGVTIDAGAVARSADFNTYAGTLTSAAQSLTLGDATAGAGNRALRFVAGMTVTGSPVFNFISTSATVQTIDFAGKTTSAVTFNGAGGSWQYTGAHTVLAAATVTLSQGTLDLNGQTVSWGLFNSNNGNTRSIILGAANITITGSGTPWNVANATGLTFSGASSTITLSATGAIFAVTSGQTYGTVNMTGAGNMAINGGGTYGTLTRTGTAAKTDGLAPGNNMTVTSVLTFTGNSTINRIQVASNSVGTARTLTTTGATVTATNTDFMDITLSVTKDFSAQTDIGDAGGNTGITFPASVQQTATGTASFFWSTHGWTTRVPLPQDDVVINNAFIAGRTITQDMPRLGRNITFAGATGNPAFSNSTTGTIFGSLTLISGMTMSGTAGFTFAGRSSYTITSAGQTFGGAIIINAPTGTYTLQDPFTTTSNLTYSMGNFNDGGFNVTFLTFSASTTTAKTLTTGGATWTSTTTAATNVWNIPTTAAVTIVGTLNLTISQASANTRTFLGGNLTYGTVTYTVSGSTGQLNIVNSNSFAVVNFSDITNARTIAFTAGTTTTIRSTNGFNVRGTAGKLMTITSITAATHTLTSPNQQSVDYCTIINSIAVGGPWYAGSHSVDGGGNTGWIFTDPPASSGGNGGNGGLQSMKALQNLRNIV